MLRIEVYNNESPMEDTGPVLSLIQKQMESIGSAKTYEQIEQTLSIIFKPDNRAVLFVGYDANDIAAAFAFGNTGVGFESGGGYFWLNELYVDISCRRLGYAGALLSFIEKWCKRKGINYIACITGKANVTAQNMYQKNGYDLSTVVWADKSI